MFTSLWLPGCAAGRACSKPGWGKDSMLNGILSGNLLPWSSSPGHRGMFSTRMGWERVTGTFPLCLSSAHCFDLASFLLKRKHSHPTDLNWCYIKCPLIFYNLVKRWLCWIKLFPFNAPTNPHLIHPKSADCPRKHRGKAETMQYTCFVSHWAVTAFIWHSHVS